MVRRNDPSTGEFDTIMRIHQSFPCWGKQQKCWQISSYPAAGMVDLPGKRWLGLRRFSVVVMMVVHLISRSTKHRTRSAVVVTTENKQGVTVRNAGTTITVGRHRNQTGHQHQGQANACQGLMESQKPVLIWCRC